MGDNPSPRQEEEVEVEVPLDAGEQGFAESFRELVEEPSPDREVAEEAYPADYLDLTGPGEDPPDWEAPEEPEDEEVLPWGTGSPAPAANARVLRPSVNV